MKITPDRGSVHTDKNGYNCAISVTKRSCAAPISKAESHIIELMLVYTILGSFSWHHEKLSVACEHYLNLY